MADESVYRQFLRDMWDRGIIDSKTMRETLKISNAVVEKRLRQEHRNIEKGKMAPKASPFHNPQIKEDKEKIALQRGYTPEDLSTNQKGEPVISKNYNPSKPNGRPLGSKDTQKRKLKVAGAHYTIWAQAAQKAISDVVTPIILDHYGRKNVRSMTDEEFEAFEDLKFGVLANMEGEINQEKIIKLIEAKAAVPQEVREVYNNLVDSLKELTVDDLRQLQIEAIKNVQNYD